MQGHRTDVITYSHSEQGITGLTMCHLNFEQGAELKPGYLVLAY